MQCNVFKIHSCCNVSQYSLFMTKYYSIVWIDHILFTYPSVDEHLGSFYMLAIVNKCYYYFF